jgi:RNA-directed DNA polymerase
MNGGIRIRQKYSARQREEKCYSRVSNVYLHHVFDIWAHQWRQSPGRGRMIVVRYADDFVCGFEREADARAFLVDLKARMETYGLSLHPEKTRMIEFGRYATENRAKRGMGKPETFAFLGFTHICGKSRKGKFLLVRKSRSDRMRNKLREVKEQLRHRINASIPEQGKWLGQVVRGYFAFSPAMSL